MATISSLGIGSGLDLNGLLDELKSAERQKLQPIVAQQKSYKAKISAFGKLESALEKFQTATAKLNEAKLYQSVSSKVTGSSITATASADAPTGSYQIDVTNMAKTSSVATTGVADKALALGAGTVSISFGDGSSLDVNVPADESSLEAIRDAINAEQGGVSASIVNDGSGTPYRLALSSNETGTDAGIAAVTFSGDLGAQLAVDAATKVEGENATLTVNGISITSQSNRVEEAIQGVTIEIAEEGSSTMVVERNTLAVREAVSGFVKAYNELKTATSDLTKFNAESGVAGELLGDGTLRNVESRLRSTLTGGMGEGDFRMLTDIGISVQLNGTLKLDEDRLSEVVANEPQALSAFFAGEDTAEGMAGKLDQTLDQILKDRGLLDNATKGLESSIKNLDQRHERMEKSIEATIDRYRRQFGQLDSMIANMNQTSSYLAQQFDMLNAQLGRDK